MKNDDVINSTYSPEPWDYDGDFIITANSSPQKPSRFIAEIVHDDHEGVVGASEQDANRRLIAVAPELFKLAQQIVLAKHEHQEVPQDIYDAAVGIVARVMAFLDQDSGN